MTPNLSRVGVSGKLGAVQYLRSKTHVSPLLLDIIGESAAGVSFRRLLCRDGCRLGAVSYFYIDDAVGGIFSTTSSVPVEWLLVRAR
jgi:hypothetical protein